MTEANNHKLNIVIVDDELPARQSLRTMLNSLRPDCHVVGEADGVASGIQLIRQTCPDIVLLDISMEDGTGFDLLDMFPNLGFKVIFTTAFDEFALRAFRYNALDYLLKPILPRDLVASIDRAKLDSLDAQAQKVKNMLEGTESRHLAKIALHSHDGLVFLRLEQIVRLQADGNYTTFFCLNNERHTVAQPLREFEETLSPETFFRIHQSHIINMAFVKKLLKKEGGYVCMEDGSQLPLARRRKDEFMGWLLNKDGHL